MIIIVDEDPSDKKQRQQLLPTTLGQSFGPGIHSQQPTSYEAAPISYHIDATSLRHTPAPAPLPPPQPSYPTYPADHHHQHHHHHHHHNHQEHHPAAGVAVAVVYRRSPVRRFFQALAVALVIYLALVSLTAHSLVRMANRGYHRADDQGVPRATDGRVITSIGGTNWTSHHSRPRWAPAFEHSADTSFTLPITADELYLISRGSCQGGNVHVTQSNEVGREVRVDVRVAYHDPRALARATVCNLRKGEDAHGVGIYTPAPASWTDPRDQLQFDVVWTLPASLSQHAPLDVRAFTTDTGNFAYDIDDLWQGVAFDDLRLSTSNGRVHIESITLTRGSVTSSNGAIVGHFNTSDVLKLHTSNAPIEATASLLSAGGRDKGPVQLEMRTSNGKITSSVSLMTPSSGSGSNTRWAGDFLVQARTSNGAVQLRYDDMPLGARLASDVRTSNAGAWVGMHPAYEGRYAVSTSNSRAVIREDARVVDPSGRGRRRVVTQTRTRNGSGVSGEVKWVEGAGGEGGSGRRRAREENLSTVVTSNARAELEL